MPSDFNYLIAMKLAMQLSYKLNTKDKYYPNQISD